MRDMPHFFEILRHITHFLKKIFDFIKLLLRIKAIGFDFSIYRNCITNNKHYQLQIRIIINQGEYKLGDMPHFLIFLRHITHFLKNI
jgi:hypothetical protein